MKILFATLTIALLMPKIAEANNTCRPLGVLSNNMELDKSQHIINRDLAGLYKQHFQITKEFHSERLDGMVKFLEGTLTRKDIHKQVQLSHKNRMDQSNEIRVTFFELLETFSQVQQEQLRSNLVEQQRCYIDKKARKNSSKPSTGKILFENLNVTSDQQRLITEVYHDRTATMNEPKVYGLHHETTLNGYLSGTGSSSSFETQAANESDFRYNQVDALLDVLESFTISQKQQFIKNVETVQAL